MTTIVTPSLNAARYIAETLESVRSQSDSAIEHIVVDGGSVDGTLAILETSPGVRLIVAGGLNQSAAVNLGVAEARGDVVIILNADDVLYPGGVAALMRGFDADPTVAAVYGDAFHLDDEGREVRLYPTRSFDAAALAEGCYICQPASAVRRSAFQAVGGMDPALDIALDYEFWMRLAKKHRFVKIDAVVAASRMHRANKTIARRSDVFSEVITVLRRHYGYVPYTWSYAYASWLLYRKDGFFDQPRPSPIAVLFSLVLGLWLNSTQPLRAFLDWYGHRAAGKR